MSKIETYHISCPNCGAKNQVPIYHSVTASLYPDQKELLFADELNNFDCDSCQGLFKLQVPILYHDAKKKIAVWYATNPEFTPPEERLPSYMAYIAQAPVVHSLDDLRTAIGE